MTADARAGGAEAFAGVHVLADDDPRWPHDPVTQARAACAGGAAVVQLRSKHATDRQTVAWGEEIRRITRRTGVLLFVNDRFDLALRLEADGVHLGQTDLPPERLPQAARDRLRVGRSTHDDEEVGRACREPVDYVAFGPLFGTTSKSIAHSERGLPKLRQVVERVRPRPLIAIGGIDAARAPEVAATGARGIAVIGAVAGATDPEAATRELVQAFGRARP